MADLPRSACTTRPGRHRYLRSLLSDLLVISLFDSSIMWPEIFEDSSIVHFSYRRQCLSTIKPISHIAITFPGDSDPFFECARFPICIQIPAFLKVSQISPRGIPSHRWGEATVATKRARGGSSTI
jgi:hypothetical protein